MQNPAIFYVTTVGHLGRGGLGTVDIVEVTSDGGLYPRGTRFASKKLGPKWANDTDARNRFEREILMLERMNHPSIVKVMGQNLPGGERNYLMPLYPRSLRKVLNEHNNAIARNWVANFGITVARALQYAHGMNFIHRDLKPENILMDGNRSRPGSRARNPGVL